MNKKVAIPVLVAVVIIVIALVVYWYGSSGRQTAVPSAEHLPVAQMNSQTAQNDPAFAEAVQAEGQGEYTSAIADLQSALHSTNDPLQTAVILSHLQQDYQVVGEYGNVIQTLQQIASTSAYPAISRAYAVEELGLLYVRYPNASSTSEIFAAAPYQDLYVAMNWNRTMRNLFSYSTTIYPLPISEYYIAQSYANSIFNQHLLTQATSAAEQTKLATLKQNVVSSFKAGDAALARVTQNPPTAVYLLNAQLMRAVVLGDLQQIGNTSLGNAEQAFQDALAAYDSQNSANDGGARLQYAYFLADMYGTSRASDITSILAPIVGDGSHGGAITESVLKGYISAPTSPAKTNLVLLATLDPDFKTFLVSLGWTSADFSTTTSAGASQ